MVGKFFGNKGAFSWKGSSLASFFDAFFRRKTEKAIRHSEGLSAFKAPDGRAWTV